MLLGVGWLLYAGFQQSTVAYTVDVPIRKVDNVQVFTVKNGNIQIINANDMFHKVIDDHTVVRIKYFNNVYKGIDFGQFRDFELASDGSCSCGFTPK